ncbi:TadE/TadG family type IV pilus assembly protein [Paenibacillus sp. 32352]|uniref:TadE/TadG family type IV pilus assembly protein n=1 Tax=Paenibacillus sp. 32352 TaxID=1969111 RepID=UPI0021182F1E|nr:TadE family protein [Paenibacillus sp. 32352]
MPDYQDGGDGVLKAGGKPWIERVPNKATWRDDQEGGIVLEAALVLPLFLSFILVLIAFIQISLAEMALQSAVTDTTKVVAANMYPVDLLYQQARSKWNQSAASGWIDKVVGQIESAKQKAVDAEQFIEDYERWIPDPVVQLVEWEKTYREHLENLGNAKTEEAKKQLEEAYKPLLSKAVTPLVAHYANPARIKKDRLKVTKVILPDLEHKENAFVGIEAQYEVPLSIPFFKKTVIVRKQAFERAWVGGTG